MRTPMLLLVLSSTVLACEPAGSGDPGTNDETAAERTDRAAVPGDAPDSPADSPRAAEPIANVSCEAYVENGLLVQAGTREAFEAELGEPDEQTSETVPNRHDPSVTDTIFRLRYPGLTARIHKPGQGRELLERVEVRDSRHLRYPGLGIGADADVIVAALGEPEERTTERLVYSCGPEPGADNPVIFRLQDGQVAEVHFTYYVD